MKWLRTILLAIIVLSIGALLFPGLHTSGRDVAEASDRLGQAGALAAPATLTSLQQTLLDNLNADKFAMIETEEGDIVGFTNSDGVIRAESPGFWRALGKATIVGLSGGLGLSVGGAAGCAIGLAASAIFVTELNSEGSIVQDIFLYTDVTVEGQGDILPDIIALGSANITDTVSLEDVFGADSSISFVDPSVFSVRVVDENFQEVTSIAGSDAFLLTDPADVTAFGVVVYNDPQQSGRPIEFTDHVDIDLASLITAPAGSEVSSTGTLITGNERLISASRECALPPVPPVVGGIAELPVGSSDTPARAADGSASSAPPYAALAAAAVAAAVATGAGGWYVRRRWLR